ncbi:MAG: hypothetical protein AB8B53_03080 [Flavobacteriales bacterium]
MKNLMLIAGAVFVLSLASCKKDYDCECTGSSFSADITYPLNDQKKSDAEDACDAFDTTFGLTGGSCELN